MPKLTLCFKGQAISVHHLKSGRMLVGRDADCDLAVDSLAISPRHAEIDSNDDMCRIRALDEDNPVFVNDAIVEEAELSHGDTVKIGKHTLNYSSDAVSLEEPTATETPAATDPKAGEKSASAYVQILSGEHIGRIIPLNRSMIRLGKAGGDCAMIVHRDGGFFLSHLEGNMPSLDGMPIGEERVMLNDGCIIRIGDTELQFYR